MARGEGAKGAARQVCSLLRIEAYTSERAGWKRAEREQMSPEVKLAEAQESRRTGVCQLHRDSRWLQTDSEGE